MAVIASAPLTIDEFSRLPGDFERHELSAGKLITTPPLTALHILLATNLSTLIDGFLDKSKSSRCFCHAGFVLGRNPLTVRQPNVAVVNREQMRTTGPDDYLEGGPELAVEIVSPSDSGEDLQVKIVQYLAGGAKQVWVLYPKNKRVQMFYSDGTTAMLDETQTLSGGDLLPQFSVKVADLFLSENHANAGWPPRENSVRQYRLPLQKSPR